jgi:hypothetical protein
LIRTLAAVAPRRSTAEILEVPARGGRPRFALEDQRMPKPSPNRSNVAAATLTPLAAALCAAMMMAAMLALPSVAHSQQMRNAKIARAPAGDTTCGRAAQSAAHDPWLAVRRGDTAPLRAGSKMRAQEAARAAGQGRDKECWRQLGLAEEMKRP